MKSSRPCQLVHQNLGWLLARQVGGADLDRWFRLVVMTLWLALFVSGYRSTFPTDWAANGRPEVIRPGAEPGPSLQSEQPSFQEGWERGYRSGYAAGLAAEEKHAHHEVLFGQRPSSSSKLTSFSASSPPLGQVADRTPGPLVSQNSLGPLPPHPAPRPDLISGPSVPGGNPVRPASPTELLTATIRQSGVLGRGEPAGEEPVSAAAVTPIARDDSPSAMAATIIAASTVSPEAANSEAIVSEVGETAAIPEATIPKFNEEASSSPASSLASTTHAGRRVQHAAYGEGEIANFAQQTVGFHMPERIPGLPLRLRRH